MPLTPHERLHLQAVVNDSKEAKKKNMAMRQRLADAKGVGAADFMDYCDMVAEDAKKALDADAIPDTGNISIADYYEKRDVSERIKEKKRVGRRG